MRRGRWAPIRDPATRQSRDSCQRAVYRAAATDEPLVHSQVVAGPRKQSGDICDLRDVFVDVRLKSQAVVFVKWKRANDGFVESVDGQWAITPLYCGCTRPQMFELRRTSDYTKVVGSGETQKQCKERAEYLKEQELKAVGKS